MPTQAAFQNLEPCPTCRGRGFIQNESAETFFPNTVAYSAAKLVLAFILGFLMLSPALLGLYWENLLGRW